MGICCCRGRTRGNYCTLLQIAQPPESRLRAECVLHCHGRSFQHTYCMRPTTSQSRSQRRSGIGSAGRLPQKGIVLCVVELEQYTRAVTTYTHTGVAHE